MHLDGFPGPYAAYVYQHNPQQRYPKTHGKHCRSRHAKFQSVIAYCDDQTRLSNPNASIGEVKGEITTAVREEQGKSGFGFDPIFQPKGSPKTFAEMAIEEKNGYSHRAMAIRKFAEWYHKTVS